MLKHYYDNLTFGHCVVCSSSIYGFWLPRWYLHNENVDIKYGSHDTLQESAVSKVIIVMLKYCNDMLVKSS
jgi:hypothetical protein